MGEKEQMLCGQLDTCLSMLLAVQSTAKMMVEFFPHFWFGFVLLVFYFKGVNFHHHVPDVEVQILSADIPNSSGNMVTDLHSLCFPTLKTSKLESGINYSPLSLSSSLPAQSSVSPWL